jgi:formamidase
LIYYTILKLTNKQITTKQNKTITYSGLIGTAPSPELLKLWNDREKTLVDEEGTELEKTLCGCLMTRPLACLPEAKGAMLGTLGHFLDKSGNDEEWDRVANEGGTFSSLMMNG